MMEYKAIGREGSLTARLLTESGVRGLEFTYENSRGEKHTTLFKNGVLVFSQNEDSKDFFGGKSEVYQKLGPRLRRLLPLDWRLVLGKWFNPNEEEICLV